ncbi:MULTISPECIES: N-acetylmuramoyl-L-alanine amidase [unclassified Streptomyces]|uniref:N-acetylmuramoyl-L-alanine amidase n=1 Tax=unclassified Streptomyces TaxID=2593676 RepID=UPI002258B50E|nr:MULTISPECIES: N-acetylmuramoyl-L-alanine amidase [unclassified Streptomyces]MCX4990487.1 N-acetylmuramoyl-L-alanine amidase [Streptomyces sp. NBC_00568]MCX5004282.1 N-acetylmuramoyl-L-alanine amidase [Streptomyces sp. NBC_00638]
MRGFLASSIGVTCAAALALPLALPAPAQAGPSAATSETAVPGSTQSLPLVPLTGERALGPAAPEQGLARRDVRPFSLIGVVWDDPSSELNGRVQVRTRAAGSGHWSGWQDVETHNHEHAADPDTAESASHRVRGSTAPLWVGDSDGVEVRVDAERVAREIAESPEKGARDSPWEDRATALADSPLPRGLRLELVDPGGDPPGADARGPGREGGAPADARAGSGRAGASDGAGGVGATEIAALTQEETEREYFPETAYEKRAQPFIGPRPRIVTRRGWGANENLRERGFVYTKKVKAAFVHHTASGNKYSCSQVPSLIRGIYRYHVVSSGWRDIGYNFLVDKCGNIYEGRAGGVAKAVKGAHTLGFNTNSMGIAVLGNFAGTKPPDAALKAIARLTAWKLGLYGGNPRGKTYLTSAGGNLYRKGKNVRLNVISGHRDGFATECPGRLLYGKLGSARKTAARYQGR